MSEYVNQDKVYKELRKFWEEYVKCTGISFDAYYEQVKDQINIYYSLPAEDRKKFMDTRMMLLGKAEREIAKTKDMYYKDRKIKK